MLLVNQLAALNFANVFLKQKNVWEIKKNVLKSKKRDQNKKRKKRFTSMVCETSYEERFQNDLLSR